MSLAFSLASINEEHYWTATNNFENFNGIDRLVLNVITDILNTSWSSGLWIKFINIKRNTVKNLQQICNGPQREAQSSQRRIRLRSTIASVLALKTIANSLGAFNFMNQAILHVIHEIKCNCGALMCLNVHRCASKCIKML